MFYKIEELFKKIKWTIQRAIKGYSDYDLYSIDSWFLNIMPRMLNDFKERTHSYPHGYTYDEWITKLEEMRNYFLEGNEDTCSLKNEYSKQMEKEYEKLNIENPEELNKIINEINKKEISKLHYKREVEISEYIMANRRKGLEMFNNLFNNLWD